MNDRDPNIAKTSFPGGRSEQIEGMYEYGLSIDARSLYPTIIAQHNMSVETLKVVEDAADLKEVIKIGDRETMRSYFFWPEDLIRVGRRNEELKMEIIKIPAKDILKSDLVVLKEGEGRRTWKYNMGEEI